MKRTIRKLKAGMQRYGGHGAFKMLGRGGEGTRLIRNPAAMFLKNVRSKYGSRIARKKLKAYASPGSEWVN
jgi:hypothetical protein